MLYECYYRMSILGILLLSSALCCSAAPTQERGCALPDRIDAFSLDGEWDDESYPSGQAATYSCYPGYTRIGIIKRVCSEGQWKFMDPKGKCKKRSCGYPGDIPFGTFKLLNEEWFVFRAIVEYTCDEGYEMVSKHKRRECTETGWSNYPPKCEVRHCPPVEATHSVKVLSISHDDEYSFGEEVRFKCKDPKFKLKGPTEIFCQSDGEWNADPPTCVENDGSCDPPPVIAFGDITSSRMHSYKSGSKVTYQCPYLYILEGKADIECVNGAWEKPPVCLKPCAVAKKKVDANNLYMWWKPNSRIYIRHGGVIEFSCKDGYEPLPGTDMRPLCNLGVLQYPKCI